MSSLKKVLQKEHLCVKVTKICEISENFQLVCQKMSDAGKSILE
jgi:hypothetical protein